MARARGVFIKNPSVAREVKRALRKLGVKYEAHSAPGGKKKRRKAKKARRRRNKSKSKARRRRR